VNSSNGIRLSASTPSGPAVPVVARELRLKGDDGMREIEPSAWKRCAVVEKVERESLRHVLDSWKGVDGGAP
jgi:hypothetical protein